MWSKMHIGLHVKYTLFLSDFNETWIFLTDLWKLLKHLISWKSIQWKSTCSMQRAYMTKLITAFCNFANAYKKRRGERWQEIKHKDENRKRKQVTILRSSHSEKLHKHISSWQLVLEQPTIPSFSSPED